MNSSEFISIRLFGGLGNQIFQYMAGKWLASERKLPLYVDRKWLQDGYSHENSSIEEFNFYKPHQELGKGHKNSLSLYLDRFLTVAARKSNYISNVTKINAPKNPGFEDLTKIGANFQLRGYYQSPEYFMWLKESGEINNSSFDLKNSNLNIRNLPTFNKEFFAIHVRGGDYLHRKSVYSQLDIRYYKEAIYELNNISNDLPIWVFSDDLKYAKTMLSSFPKLNFVDKQPFTAAETMKLMSMAEGIVCANSTFSYWASMICLNPRIIVAPKRWLKNVEQPSNFFPSNWKVI